MTADEPHELDPTAEARLRALLADSRVTEPMPPTVVDRLSETLVGLAAGRTAAGGRSPDDVEGDSEPVADVVAISPSRRHRVTVILGAAAAVVFFGVGLGYVVDRSPSDSAHDATSAQTAVERGADAELSEGGGAAGTDASDSAKTKVASGDGMVERVTVVSRVRAQHLARDVRRVQRTVLPDPADADYAPSVLKAPPGFSCRDAAWGPGVVVPVQYDGAPAVVAFREPVGQSQVAEVLQCGTAEVLRSTTIPVD